MTTLVDASPGNASRRPGRRLVGVIAVLVAVAGVGFAAGTAWSSHRTDLGGWHTGTALVGADQVSIEYDGWTYGGSLEVPSWIDTSGTQHDAGRPACFRGRVGRTLEVRFQARVVTIDGSTSRPIVAIDCRGAHATD